VSVGRESAYLDRRLPEFAGVRHAIARLTSVEKNQMKLYVGNLPWSVTDADLSQLFAGVGQVNSAQVIMDRDTGRSRGFGFVEMSQDDGRRAISEIGGRQLENRELRVNEATERTSR
jgi:RNA recognition motif-containing protein